MRVLISTWAWRSHYYPLVPFVWALLAAGHEVRVACQPSLVPAVAATGVPVVPVGEDLDLAKVYAEMAAAGEISHDTESTKITPGNIIVRYAEAVVDDLVAFGRSWRPDVVVHEPFNLAAMAAAQILCVPVVKHLWAADFTAIYGLDPAVASRFGLSALRTDSDLVLDPCPAAMQLPGDASPRALMRFVPYNGDAVLPEWLRTPGSRPLVCVTWGTLMAELGSDLFLAPQVAEALGELDVDVVVTTDPASHPRFGPLPPNVFLASPQLALHLVLPSCAAVVHMGGAGTTMTAMAAGVPQLVLPQVGDQQFNAAQLAKTGAGLIGDVEGVAGQVSSLLSDPSFAEAAADLARENASRPSPAQIVAELMTLL
ncbi:nucleotide disphospho-sugar-binding domain-containing protein [Lentzea sp. NPDC051838]|uniref:nucleotide disphospho-sugar-binding domain-containing protein n=1 Tax=Lentzea sp. NPDC051838 TaxID=3154849 RepID=UPI003417EB03